MPKTKRSRSSAPAAREMDNYMDNGPAFASSNANAFRYRLRGGAEGEILLSSDKVNAECSCPECGDIGGIVLMESPSRLYAFNFGHVAYFAFFEMSTNINGIAKDSRHNVIDVYLVNERDPISIELDSEYARLLSECEGRLQKQLFLFGNGNKGNQYRYISFPCKGGERVWFQLSAVAMISIPMAEPKARGAKSLS